MTNYELMFIVDSTLEDSAREQAVETVKGIIAANGEIVKADLWGMKKLAYPINKKNEGYYVLVDFKSDGEFPKELDRRLKISDSIVRHMIINKDEK
ncbi:MAG: 30S ribosomal protein S6 [Clostridiales bacterium]|nr:30S ribosomal protein S6 [Clostridiales bacterium]